MREFNAMFLSGKKPWKQYVSKAFVVRICAVMAYDLHVNSQGSYVLHFDKTPVSYKKSAGLSY